MDIDRINFAKESLSKSKNFSLKDSLIEFIILWIGFNALYGEKNKRFEIEKIKAYLLDNKNVMIPLFKENSRKLKDLVHFVDETIQHEKLSDFLKSRRAFLRLENITDNSVTDFAEVIYEVRNNLFHAVKLWSQKDEEKLVSLFNPILRSMLSILISK